MPDLLLLVLPAVCLWGVGLARPLASQLNTACLSPNRTASLRGALALAVIFVHLAQWTVCGPISELMGRTGPMVVAGFFFLSGYGLQRQHMIREDYSKGFLLKRLMTVALPYLVVTAIYWSYYLWLGRPYDLIYVLTRFATGNPLVSFSWYIPAVIGFYAAFWLLMRRCKKNHRAMLVGGIIWFAVHTAVCMILHFSDVWYISALSAVAGMAWAVYQEQLEALLRRYYFAALAAVAVLFAGCLLAQRLTDIWLLDLIFKTASTTLFSLGMVLVLYKLRLGNPLLRFLGQLSMELYLMQGLAMMVIRNRVIFVENDLLYCALVLPISVIFASILHIAFHGLPKKAARKPIKRRRN